MFHRSLTVSFVLSIMSVAACTEGGPDGDATAAAAREWECVSFGFGLPQGTVCRLTTDEPGFQIVPPAPTCASRRPIDVCGDGCCDVSETSWRGPIWCPADCRLERLEVADELGTGRPQVRVDGRVMATLDARSVSVVASDVCE